MAALDSIFQKSNLEESKRQAKMLFGRLLIALRKSNHIKLYSLLESVNETDIVEGKLVLTLFDKVAFDMINNKNDIAELEGVISGIKAGFKIELACNGKEPFDKFKFETFLKNEFGNCLTIK
ncbi:MAG: hypothetical protein IJW59_02470 [Clostridia bacterium]|nr:hypothetical protein [Clostridia bacterium]